MERMPLFERDDTGRHRPPRLPIRVLVWALGIALSAGAVGVSGDLTNGDEVNRRLYEQRVGYRRAIHAIRVGRNTEFRREAARLGDYPLHPYLIYFDARRRLSSIGVKQARDLRAVLADTPIAQRFFRQWLNAQARRGHWGVYLAHYEPTTDPAARCNYLRALYRSGARAEALGQVRELWVAPRSQPKTCDPLFKVWIDAGYLTLDAVWERLALALDAGEVTLGRYLLRFFDRKDGAGRLYYDAHARPAMVRSPERFPNDKNGRRALRHGLLRYARKDAQQALELWTRVSETHSFTAANRRDIYERLTAAVAAAGHVPDDYLADFSAGATEQIALSLIRHRHWPEAARWITALPTNVVAKPRWRYWLGRSLIDSGEAAQAGGDHLAAIAKLRNYYGFLAAEDLGTSPVLNATAPLRDFNAQRALLDIPALRRMAELYAVGDLVNARREWRYALPSLTVAEQRHLVEWTAALGWVDQAIYGARDAKLNDLVEVRFPMPHQGIFKRHAFNVNLPVPFLFAVSRQESAFNPGAVSGRGARGLMQLMPATARLVADRVRVPRPSGDDLFDPHVNIHLGAHHLAALMTRYRGNRALAAAAYNAGERRVDRWLEDASGIPTRVWIERIPFRETREYVKGVIAFNYVYNHLSGSLRPVLAAHERTINVPVRDRL